MQLSPDGTRIVFRTNRDALHTAETSIWSIDIAEGTESCLVSPDLNNDMVGFLDNNTFVVGALNNTRIVDVTNGEITPLIIPELPNRNIRGTQDGKLAIYSYDDIEATVSVYTVNKETGELMDVVSVHGRLDSSFYFSPKGDKIAVRYGTADSIGREDIIILDLIAGTSTLYSDFETSIKGTTWLDNETLIVTVGELR